MHHGQQQLGLNDPADVEREHGDCVHTDRQIRTDIDHVQIGKEEETSAGEAEREQIRVRGQVAPLLQVDRELVGHEYAECARNGLNYREGRLPFEDVLRAEALIAQGVVYQARRPPVETDY